jgi:hypothetical protein
MKGVELVVSQEGVVGDFTNNRFGGEVDNQLAVPTETKAPTLHRATNRSSKNADGRIAYVA